MSAEHLRRLWPVLLMSLILTVALYFSRGTITANLVVDVHRLPVEIFAEKSQSFIVSLPSFAPFELNSFALSGNVIGNGRAMVYIDDGNGLRYLVYSNEAGASSVLDVDNEFGAAKDDDLQVTKYRELAGSLTPSNNAIVLSGYFRRACSETCHLPEGKFNSGRYELLVFVDEGTTISLNELLYK